MLKSAGGQSEINFLWWMAVVRVAHVRCHQRHAGPSVASHQKMSHQGALEEAELFFGDAKRDNQQLG